jgi:Flp pilus assembly protein TadB
MPRGYKAVHPDVTYFLGMTAVLAIIHAGLAAAWVGGMAYSLFVVQPKLKRYFGKDQDGREQLTAVIASGNRWKVIGLIAAIALTGGAMLAIDHAHWWIHAVKGLLLLIATGIFWYVSWRHWPQRVFATAAELPTLQRRLIILATAMLGLAGLAFALGVLAEHL